MTCESECETLPSLRHATSSWYRYLTLRACSPAAKILHHKPQEPYIPCCADVDPMASAGPGGFIPFSPPASSVASATPHALPHPRSTPLKPGGTKESSFIRYVDNQILHIQRRFAKRDAHLKRSGVREMDEEGRELEEVNDDASMGQLGRPDEWRDVPGYPTFADAARDVEELVGVTWVSGTRTLLRSCLSTCLAVC